MQRTLFPFVSKVLQSRRSRKRKSKKGNKYAAKASRTNAALAFVLYVLSFNFVNSWLFIIFKFACSYFWKSLFQHEFVWKSIKANHSANRTTWIVPQLISCLSCSYLDELLGLLKINPHQTPTNFPSHASHFQTLCADLLAEGFESNQEHGGEIPSTEPGYNSLAIFP